MMRQIIYQGQTQRLARSFAASAEELAAHHALLDKMRDPIWRPAAAEAKSQSSFSWPKSLRAFLSALAAAAGPYFADKGQGNL